MNHVSVSPTDGNGPTQGQRKTLTRVGIEPTTFGLDLRRSTHFMKSNSALRMRQHTFSKVTVIIWKTVYISKEIARDCGQSFSLSLCGPISISRANAHMVHMG